ncbi:hypothetical protein EYF80_021757 [Liparis tanakae]|uniref:Uncharacterized protein n=1 Tax=Liparis tanakae TaxID=230148 RepID=A0A4Z2HRL8_9TELE|nr:hypothetical protein EYF80_021757 [Liparis tanakae]
MSTSRFKKDKEIIADYESQVKVAQRRVGKSFPWSPLSRLIGLTIEALCGLQPEEEAQAERAAPKPPGQVL